MKRKRRTRRLKFININAEKVYLELQQKLRNHFDGSTYELIISENDCWSFTKVETKNGPVDLDLGTML
jgi:hypothetical protein